MSCKDYQKFVSSKERPMDCIYYNVSCSSCIEEKKENVKDEKSTNKLEKEARLSDYYLG